MRQKPKLSSIVLGLCLIQPAIAAASAVTVPIEARETAQAAVMEVQARTYAEEAAKYRREADDYMLKSAEIAKDADQQIVSLKKDLAEKTTMAKTLQISSAKIVEQANIASSAADALMQEAQSAWQAAGQAAQAAEVQAAQLDQQIAEADAVSYAAAESTDYQQQAANQEVAAAQSTDLYPEETDELLLLESEMRRQEAALFASREVSSAVIEDDYATEVSEPAEAEYPDFSGAQAAVDGAYAAAAGLQSEAEARQADADSAYAIAELKQAEADKASIAAEQAKQAVLDHEYMLKDAEMTAEGARKEAAGAKAYYEQLVYEQDNPPAYRYAETALEYYRWKSGDNHGYQLVQPISYGYSAKNNYAGFSINHIIADNMSGRNSGKINTFSDTLAYFSKKNEHEKFIVNYALGMNIPTGKASLSARERNARMNDDLVRYSQFGEGWNISPEIAVTNKINKEDSFTVKMGYSWRGSYDPTSDIEKDDLDPGDEWRTSLKWQHSSASHQFVGELLYTTTGISSLADGSSYETGDAWETRLTYNRVLPKEQNLMLYYWYKHEDSTMDLGRPVKVAPRHYFGAEWSKSVLPNRTLRVSLDGMAANGRLYDSMNNDYIDGRHKYTLGLGYDIKLKEDRNLSLDIQKFILNDGTAQYNREKRYNGINVFLKYGGSF